MQAVIPCAGKGKRMRPITKFKPKVMLPVLNKPVLEYIIEKLKFSGIDEIICVTGEKGGEIRNYFPDLIFVEQKIPLGTGDAVLRCKELIKGEFLLVWGDHIFEFDIREVIGFHEKHHCFSRHQGRERTGVGVCRRL